MNSNALIPIEYEGNRIRTFITDGEPWFSLTDVCAVLGIVNPGNAKTRLEQVDVRTTDVDIPRADTGTLIKQTINIVNESGLYDLIFQSRKPEARKFRHRVTKEILPSIRKKGYYGTPSAVQYDFQRRYVLNYNRVERGYFSVINETFRVVYPLLEHRGFIIPDKHKEKDMFIRPDVSIGRLFKAWMEQHHPEELERYPAKTYSHITGHGFIVKAKQYPVELQRSFDFYALDEWMINVAPGYFRKRLGEDDQVRLEHAVEGHMIDQYNRQLRARG